MAAGKAQCENYYEKSGKITGYGITVTLLVFAALACCCAAAYAVRYAAGAGMPGVDAGV